MCMPAVNSKEMSVSTLYISRVIKYQTVETHTEDQANAYNAVNCKINRCKSIIDC